MSDLFRLPIIILLAGLLLLLTAGTSLAQDPSNGQTVWENLRCQACHGPEGQGAWAGPLAGTTREAADWIAQVRNPRNRMPMFSEAQVSDADITDMHAYLATLSRPENFAPQQADLPTDAPAGQQLLVEKRCVACHGENGPINGFINRGETPTAELVLAQVRTPRNAMPSYSEAQVSDTDVALIADFLASQVPPSQLPETGSPLTNPLLWLVTGGLALAGLGFVVRRRLAKI